MGLRRELPAVGGPFDGKHVVVDEDHKTPKGYYPIVLNTRKSSKATKAYYYEEGGKLIFHVMV